MNSAAEGHVRGVTLLINGTRLNIPWGINCVNILANCKALVADHQSDDRFVFTGPEFDSNSVDTFIEIACSRDEDFSSISKNKDPKGVAQRRCLLSMALRLRFDKLAEFVEGLCVSLNEDITTVKLEAAVRTPGSAASMLHQIVEKGFCEKLLELQTPATCARILDEVSHKTTLFNDKRVQRGLMNALLKRIEKDPAYSLLVRYVNFSQLEIEQVLKLLEIEDLFVEGIGTSDHGLTILRYVNELRDSVRDLSSQIDRAVGNSADYQAQDTIRETFDQVFAEQRGSFELGIKGQEDDLMEQMRELEATLAEVREARDELQRVYNNVENAINSRNEIEVKVVMPGQTMNLVSEDSGIDFDAKCEPDLEGSEYGPRLKQFLFGRLPGGIWRSAPYIMIDSPFPAFVIDFGRNMVIVSSYSLSCPDDESAIVGWEITGQLDSEKPEVIDRRHSVNELRKGEEVEYPCAKVFACRRVRFALIQRSKNGMKQISLRTFKLFGKLVPMSEKAADTL